ncbi:hypothetical protein Pcinc_010006 [Petrolisthes cinctipes]|uniref:Uncharacterized protein n=1 Tax=Petrolisthes cinctipes TaxID=88211 RepID=A0AAE1G6C3_PETCI|nr:hypothetical protein Pcinc_010006 [Petrolisthes cinctipes]
MYRYYSDTKHIELWTLVSPVYLLPARAADLARLKVADGPLLCHSVSSPSQRPTTFQTATREAPATHYNDGPEPTAAGARGPCVGFPATTCTHCACRS